MHERHPEPVIGLCIIFINVVGLLLGNYAHTGHTSLEWPSEMTLSVTVDHCNGAAKTQTLKQIHQGKGLCTNILIRSKIPSFEPLPAHF